MPSRSSDMSNASLLQSAKLTLRVFATRRSAGPLRRTRSMPALNPCHNRSVNARSRASSFSTFAVAISAARTKPTMPATFSVPARLVVLMAAAVEQRLDLRPRSNPQRADAFRAINLVTADAQQIHRHIADNLQEPCPTPARTSTWNSTPALAADRADLAHGLERAGLIVRTTSRSPARCRHGWHAARRPGSPRRRHPRATQ